jgi:fructokinase
MEKALIFNNTDSSATDPSFLLLGEAVVDMISIESAQSLEDVGDFKRFAGGQVANLAMNLARLGYIAILGSCIGQDENGSFLRESLENAGVVLDALQTTRQALTTQVRLTKTVRTPDFKIKRGADQFLKLSDILTNAVENVSLIHTSAFALSRNPTRDTVLTSIDQSLKKGKIISLDPNYHPSIQPDRKDFLSFLLDVFSKTTVLKPSLDDSQRIFGSGYQPITYLEKFLSLGPQIVILTMGNQGSLLGTQEGNRYHILPNLIEVLDVTGAGDAYWTGTILGLASGLTPLKAACLGQSIAEHKIRVFGPISEFFALDFYLDQAQKFVINKL